VVHPWRPYRLGSITGIARKDSGQAPPSPSASPLSKFTEKTERSHSGIYTRCAR
jgi:hypothetical protein